MAVEVAGQALINGVDVKALGEKAEALRNDPGLGKSRFRITNRWLGCGRNRSTVTGFHALRQEIPHEQAFELEADEPPVLLTIDGWFDLIENARARGAETIDVTWDADFGFPADGFIDESTLIADEEISWSIPSLTPLR